MLWCRRIAVVILWFAAVAPASADDWPEFRGKGRLGIWHETGILEEFPEDGLTVKWRVPIQDGYAGPAVAGGRVFVIDARRIQANDFIERVVCLDEATGDVLWTHEWEANYAGLQLIYAIGPRATPTVDQDRVYVQGAMGRLIALRVETGDVVWEKDYVRDYNTEVPIWGMPAAPLVDGDRLISLVGGEPNAKVMAFDKLTGEEIWRADWEPGYNSPIIFEAGGRRQLIIWHPRAISSLDPETGGILWEEPFEVSMGMTLASPVLNDSYLLVSAFYNGSTMLRLDSDRPAATLLWQSPFKQTSHAVTNTPIIRLRVRHRQLRTPRLDRTGERIWESLQSPTSGRDGTARPKRRPVLHQQRSGRADHRSVLTPGISGGQSNASARADPSGLAPTGARGSPLVVSRLRQPAHLHAKRQGDHSGIAGRRRRRIGGTVPTSTSVNDRLLQLTPAARRKVTRRPRTRTDDRVTSSIKRRMWFRPPTE